MAAITGSTVFFSFVNFNFGQTSWFFKYGLVSIGQSIDWSHQCRNSSFDYAFYKCNFFLSILEWLKIFNYTCFKISLVPKFGSHTKTKSLLLHVSQLFSFLYLKCSPNCNKYSLFQRFLKSTKILLKQINLSSKCVYSSSLWLIDIALSHMSTWS